MPSPTLQSPFNLLLVLSIGQTQEEAEGKGSIDVAPTGQPPGSRNSQDVEDQGNMEGVQHKDFLPLKSPYAF